LAQPATAKRKFRFQLRPHIVIASLLLLIPIGAGAYCFTPQYSYFTAMGEIVPVQEIGVDGSVNFTYVTEGLTTNFYERWTTAMSYPDAEFEKADSSYEDYLAMEMEAGEELRNETIFHAVISADELTEGSLEEESSSTIDDDQRLASLIEEAAEYYGDSLGLMLGIGLVEEAKNVDYSRGGKYLIAGTGTLEEDHHVGSVGAIRNKLRTAEKFGTDYFFVPKDKDTFEYEGISNEEEASQVAQELNLELKVIPVASLEEAIIYLEQLDT